MYTADGGSRRSGDMSGSACESVARAGAFENKETDRASGRRRGKKAVSTTITKTTIDWSDAARKVQMEQFIATVPEKSDFAELLSTPLKALLSGLARVYLSSDIINCSSFSDVNHSSESMASYPSLESQKQAINLASMHPGAPELHSQIVNSLAKELDATVVRLWHFDILSLALKLRRIQGLPSSSLLASPSFVPAVEFRPSNFSQSNPLEDDEDDDHFFALDPDVEDELYDSDANDDSDAARGRLLSALGGSSDFGGKKSTKVTFNLHIPDVMAPRAAASSNSSSSSHSHSSTTHQSPSVLDSSHQTFFGAKLYEQDIVNVTQVLRSFLLEQPQKTIIHLPDISNALSVNHTTTSLISALVSTLQSVPQSLLVVSSSPSSITQQNLQPPSFYSSLLQGNEIFDVASKSLHTFSESEIFATALDSMPRSPFTKVPILPPKYAFDESSKDKIDSWCHAHQRSLEQYWARAAFKGLEIVCLSRGFSFERNLQGLKEVPEELKAFLKDEMWTMERLERSVELALSFSLTSSTLNSSPNPSNLTASEIAITRDSLARALDIMRQLVFTSPSMAHGQSNEGSGGVGHTLDDAKISNSAKSSGPTLGDPTPFTRTTELPKAEEESTSERLLRELEKKGKLSTYEKKVLNCVVDPATIQLSFADLILPTNTKSTLQSMVSLPLQRPDLFTGLLATHFISGCLLFGPPGTGKTILAKAIAKNCNATFLNVSLSDIFDKYVGEGEKNVRAIFSIARKLSPSVIFCDEVDALFTRRDGSREGRREVLNEFMMEWDGLLSRKIKDDGRVPRVLVMGATNRYMPFFCSSNCSSNHSHKRPFDLDDAILRRMPKRILVDLPNEDARKKILHVHLRQETLDSDVELDRIVSKTKGWSGSDLKV